MTNQTKKTNIVRRIALIVLGVVLVGFGLNLLNVSDNITAFGGLVCLVSGLGLAGSNAYAIIKEKTDQ